MSNEEQQFTIQPHPAKTNDPADLQQPGRGLNNKHEIDALNAKGGGYIPTAEQVKNMEAPLSRAELKKRQEEINK